jgi:hypothetical protein
MASCLQYFQIVFYTFTKCNIFWLICAMSYFVPDENTEIQRSTHLVVVWLRGALDENTKNKTKYTLCRTLASRGSRRKQIDTTKVITLSYYRVFTFRYYSVGALCKNTRILVASLGAPQKYDNVFTLSYFPCFSNGATVGRGRGRRRKTDMA